MWSTWKPVLLAAAVLGGGVACGAADGEWTDELLESDAALATADGLVSATLTMDSDWGQGYCATVKVANLGVTATASWEVRVALGGSTMTSSHSSLVSVSSGTLTARSLTWNTSIAPGAATQFGFCAASTSSSQRPTVSGVTQQGATGASAQVGPLLSQLQTAGLSGADQEFVELYNPNAQPLSLGGYSLVYRSASGTTDTPVKVFATGDVIPPRSRFLLVHTGADVGVFPDGAFSASLSATGGGLALRNAAGVVDSLGWGTATNAYVEGTAVAAPPVNGSVERLPGGAAGNTIDSNRNVADFRVLSSATPRNSGRAPGLLISELQVAGATAADEEFVELRNTTAAPLNLASFRLVYRSVSGTTLQLTEFTARDVVPAGGHFLVGRAGFPVKASPNALFTTALARDGGSVAVLRGTDTVVDSLSWGTGTGIYVEGVAAPAVATGHSLQRRATGTAALLLDTGNNSLDFVDAATPTPQGTAAPDLLISEVQTGGSASAHQEFIELYNTTGARISLAGYSLRYRSAAGTSDTAVITFGASHEIAARGRFLLGHEGVGVGVAADATFPSGLAAEGGGLALYSPAGAVVDGVAWGTATNSYVERAAAAAPAPAQSITRLVDVASGGHQDTNSNRVDFVVAAPTPQGTGRDVGVIISEVQTAGLASPDQEFIEIRNSGKETRALAGYRLVYRSATGTSNVAVISFDATHVLAPGEHLLLTHRGYSLGVSSDGEFTASLALAGGGLALLDPLGNYVDRLAWGTAQNGFVEGSAAAAPAAGASIERLPGGAAGAGQDTNHNGGDFAVSTQPTPRGLASSGKGFLIAEVQTSGSAGPDQEFIELVNTNATPRSLSGLRIVYRSATGVSDVLVSQLAAVPGTVAPKARVVLAHAGYNVGVVPDGTFTASLGASGGGLALVNVHNEVVDSVGWGTATNAYVEAQPAPAPLSGGSIERVGGDTNNNLADFILRAVSQPR